MSINALEEELKVTSVQISAQLNPEGSFELDHPAVRQDKGLPGTVSSTATPASWKNYWRPRILKVGGILRILHNGLKQGYESQPSNFEVPEELLVPIKEALVDESSVIRRLSTIPIERTFVNFDISSYSTYSSTDQLGMVQYLLMNIRDCLNRKSSRHPFVSTTMDDLENFLCIGDGYILAFKTAREAVYFTAWLAYTIQKGFLNKEIGLDIHFRIGIHTAPIYFFWDWGRGKSGDWNYIGDGINGATRVTGAIGTDLDDVIYLSLETKQAIQKADARESILGHLVNKGTHLDKHKKPWRVYQLNHEGYITEPARAK